MDAVTYQPTKVGIQKAILNFTGNIISLRAFQMSGPSNIGEIHYHKENKANGGEQIKFSAESNQFGKKNQKWE